MLGKVKWALPLFLIAVMGAAVLRAQYPDVLYYKFNEGTGSTVANDANPGQGANPATFTPAPIWNTATPPLGAASRGAAASVAPTGYSHNTTGSFTIEFWMIGTSGTFGYLCGDPGAGNFRIFAAGAAGAANITLRGGGFTNINLNNANDGSWHHVAFVYDAGAGTMTAYLDGVQSAQNVAQTGTGTGSGFFAGNNQASTTQAFLGDMDEFRLWSVARTGAEIAANMNTELTNTFPSLVPATGSAFSGSLTYAGLQGSALANATLEANDPQGGTIDITVTPVTPAPGVTAPSSQTGVTVPTVLTFTGTPTAGGTYTYNFSLTDGSNVTNRTVTFNIQTPAAFPFLENFDAWATDITNPVPLPAPWQNVTTDGANDWYIDIGGTSSAGTGPSVDQSTGTATGRYLYVEDSNTPNTGDVVMMTPPISLVGAIAPMLSFWVHANDNNGVGPTNNFLHVDIIDYTTSTTTLDILPPIGHIADPTLTVWTNFAVGLSAHLGNIVAFVFRVDDIGSSFSHDIAIDTVAVQEFTGPAADVGVVAINSPATGAGLTATETVSVTIRNFGQTQTNFPVQFQVNSGTPVVENFPGTLLYLSEATFVFTATANLSTPSTTYVIDAQTNLAGDSTPGNDASSITVRHKGTVSTFPYTEDFETAATADDWTVSGNVSSWELATPAGAVINSAASGTNSWTTDATGAYLDNEDGAVVSPRFNMSALTSDPWIRMAIWWDAENTWDGAVLQSSIDNGASWQNVGASGDPNNWFNFNSIDGLQAGSGQLDGWTGDAAAGSLGWVTAMHQLTGLSGQASVFLRVVFGSDTNTQADGFAFDDVWIGYPAEMDVLRGATPVADGGTDTVQILTAGTNLTYTIENNGGESLNLTGTPLVSVTAGTNVSTVTVTTLPTTPVAGGSNTTFVINVVPTAAGAYDFTVSIDNDDLDENPYDFTVSGNAVSNVPPVVANQTGSNWVDAGGGLFTLTLNPGAAIADTLEVTDPTPDNMTVDVVTSPTFTGLTAQPVDITTPTAGPISLTWTGTADGSNAPGNYDWLIDIDDGTTVVSITARIIIVDVPPQHTILNASGGDGSVATPYTYTFAVGNTGANSVDLATVTDANTSQTVTISGTPSQTSGPTGGTGFQFSLAANALTVAPAGTLVAADIGTQVFDVVVTDGNVANDQTITVSLDVVANVPPVVSVGTSNWVDAGGGLFTLTVNPGAAIADTLDVTDATPDNMTVDVTAPGTALTGLTAEPADILTPTAGPISLTWTGTAAASNTPGNYDWAIDINDGTSSTVITARIIVVDVAPQHTAATGVSGDGSVGTPYLTTFAENDLVTLSINLASVTDANTGQTLTLSNIAQGSGPTGGSGFTFSLAGGVLSVAPTATLVAADIGVQVFSMDIDDGTNTVTVNVSITVLGNSGAITFTNTSPLAAGTVGSVYATVTLTATGGTGPYTYSLANGTSLPAGLSLSATGDITGTPTTAGTVSFDVRAVDNVSDSAVASFQITINAPSSGSGGGGGDDSKCSTGGDTPYSWMMLLGLLSLAALAFRLRKA
ncbi:MAG: putative Ig domain-containing protein [Planctomycetes bacterium]|nr:putative Ig domain-containing protein [Planctomycetota bacterium]